MHEPPAQRVRSTAGSGAYTAQPRARSTASSRSTPSGWTGCWPCCGLEVGRCTHPPQRSSGRVEQTAHASGGMHMHRVASCGNDSLGRDEEVAPARRLTVVTADGAFTGYAVPVLDALA